MYEKKKVGLIISRIILLLILQGAGSLHLISSTKGNFKTTHTTPYTFCNNIGDKNMETVHPQNNIQPYFYTASPLAPTTINIMISAGNNDAEETTSTGSIARGSSILELVDKSGVTNQLVGLQFLNVNIPSGVQITNAYIQFSTHSSSTGAASLSIRGEDVGSAPVITTTAYDISSRSMTSASTAWSPPAWNTSGERGVNQQTSNISNVVQEIINRGDWVSGNNILLVISGAGERRAKSYNNSALEAPELVITYDTEVVCPNPPIEIGNYVWEDTDGDGIQEAGEPGMPGIAVQLFSDTGTLLATTETNADGQYYFSHAGDPSQTWISPADSILEHSDYYVVIESSQFSNNVFTYNDNFYTLTIPDIPGGQNADLIDSDATTISSTPNNAFDDLPAISFSTGIWGCSDHSVDFGFIPYSCIVNPDTDPQPGNICTGDIHTVDGNPSGPSGIFITHAWTDLGSGSATGYTISDTTLRILTLDATTASLGTIALQYSVTDQDFCRTIDTLLITLEEMTAAAVTNIICDDNGTTDDPTDDTFTFTLHVTGTGAEGWRGLGQSGQFNEDVLMGPFPISGGDINANITNDFCNTQLLVNVPAPDACSTEIECNIPSLISESFCCQNCPTGNILLSTSNNENYNIPTEQNIAINKPTQVSSRPSLTRSNSAFAVDGLTNGNININPDLVITTMEETPWWEVDLTGNFSVTDINIYGRTDCCATTNYDYTIIISDTPITDYNLATVSSQPGVGVFTHSQTGGGNFTITANRAGRFIRIYLQGTNQLQLAEVEVMGISHSSTNPYTYSWSDASIGNQANPDCLAPGVYTVTITDSTTGCQTVESIVID